MWKYSFLPQTLGMEEIDFEKPPVLAAGREVEPGRAPTSAGSTATHGGHRPPCPSPEVLFLLVTSSNSHPGASAFIHSLEV